MCQWKEVIELCVSFCRRCKVNHSSASSVFCVCDHTESADRCLSRWPTSASFFCYCFICLRCWDTETPEPITSCEQWNAEPLPTVPFSSSRLQQDRSFLANLCPHPPWCSVSLSRAADPARYATCCTHCSFITPLFTAAETLDFVVFIQCYITQTHALLTVSASEQLA
jgi:hypothetical protein